MKYLGFNIGSVRLDNPLIMAPMAGITNLPFRILAKEHGAAMTVTEMVSAAGLYQGGRGTLKLMKTVPSETPFCVQIFGCKPDWVARGAAVAQDAGAQVIDFNMGCPARKVVNHGSGAALLKDFKLIDEILKKTRQAVTVPLTVKTRLGWGPGQGEALELAPILADNGVDAVTLHGRYAVQRFTGHADWDGIARFVEKFSGPVIGNGDVSRPEKALAMMEATGCAGVMIGRAALGNPWIFRRTVDLLEGRPMREPDLDERLRTTMTHCRLLADLVSPERAVYMLRSVLMWYTKGLPDSTTFRQSINQVRDFALLLESIRAYFSSLAEQERIEAA